MPGANETLSAADVDEELTGLDPSVVLAQAEISAPAIRAAAGWCQRRNRRFVFNASPADDISQECLTAANPLIVNVTEARQILRNLQSPASELAGCCMIAV